MLILDIQHKGSSLSLELPLPTEVLAGELRMLGIEKTMNHVCQDEFTLTPMNELGEHFMKLVRPEDTLQAIATYGMAPFTLRGGARQALTDLIMADRFRDLDHMDDYLQHGPAALTHLIRLRLDDNQIDLPCDNLHIQLPAAGYDRPARQIRLNEVEYVPLNDLGRELLTKCSPYESIATTNLACALLSTPDINAPVPVVMDSANRLLAPIPRETVNFYCPLTVRVEDCNDNLVEGDPFLLREHEDVISDSIRNEMIPPNDNMARHMGRCSQALQDKVASAEWDVLSGEKLLVIFKSGLEREVEMG